MVFIYLEIYLCRMPHFLICMNKKRHYHSTGIMSQSLEQMIYSKSFLSTFGGGGQNSLGHGGGDATDVERKSKGRQQVV